MTSSWFRRLSGLKRRHQSGQALVYGLGVMAVALGGLFFLFNTGQLLQEKTKLVNTADAAAYAGGVMHARALNFNAYSNRALIANEVLVAHLVSVSSWSLYARNATRTVPQRFPGCNTPQGAAAYTTMSFGLYSASCFFVTVNRGGIDTITETIQSLGSPLLTAVELSKSAIKSSLNQIHAPGIGLVQSRNQVIQEIVQANYDNDGDVQVEPRGALPGSSFNLTDQWSDFTRQTTGQARVRMATVARNAAFTDQFIPNRSWTQRALVPKCWAPIEFNQVNRRGSTNLLGLDEWRASDTFVYQYRQQRWWGCRTRQTGLGSGQTRARKGGAAFSNGFSSRTWNQYSGIPAFYDLKVLDKSSPTLKFTVKLIRKASQLKTGDGRSEVRSVNEGNELNPNRFYTQLKGSRMQAMSASEVFFERPISEPNARGNELPSLFNPFWQVRLIQPDATEVAIHANAQ